MSTQNYRINERIRIREVRLIDENGNNMGVMPTQKAREYAESKELDLVEVAPDARPPVCRIMDYGKFMYEQTKKERLAKKTQKQVEIKGLRIRPDTDMYHVGFKVKQARGFIAKGNKLRIICQFRGRERSHPEIARQMMKEIAEMLNDVAIVEQLPNFEGRNMTMVLAPNGNVVVPEKPEKVARPPRPASPAESTPASTDGTAGPPVAADALPVAPEDADDDEFADSDFIDGDELDDDELDNDDLDLEDEAVVEEDTAEKSSTEE